MGIPEEISPCHTTINSKDNRDRTLFLGLWPRSIPYQDVDFAKDNLDEPHMKRKLSILKKHPEIEKLYGHEPWTKPITIVAVAVQLLTAYFLGRVWQFNWMVFLATAYFVGGTVASLVGVIIHEACHNLIDPNPLVNKFYGLLVNVALPVPICMSFRRYHLEHHTWQGVTGKDPDLPLKIELFLIQGNTFAKFIWLAFFPFLYVIRGAVFGKRPAQWEVANIFIIIASDILVWSICGPIGFAFLFVSLWFGYSFHPAAAHFIQEHYTFADGQETYSYYGWMNSFALNVGYHNEHHDFSKIPWSRLPLIKQMAPEFYDPLVACPSWYGVLWNFVTDKKLGPQSRVVRDIDDYRQGRKMINRVSGKKASAGLI